MKLLGWVLIFCGFALIVSHDPDYVTGFFLVSMGLWCLAKWLSDRAHKF
jgi:hypothetical protein